MAEEAIAFNRQELRSVLTAFKAMDQEAVQEAKSVSNGLATYLQSKIIAAAASRPNQAASRIAQGSRVSKSSKIGELWLCVSKIFRRRYNATALGRLRIRLK